MARTKASVGAKVSSGKSSKARCSAAPPPSSSVSAGSSSKAGTISGGGGNPVCAQPTPKWQRPITNFFISKDKTVSDGDSDDGNHNSDDGAGSSKTRPKKRNVIESDDEDAPETTPQPPADQDEERPRNSVLDESIELGPLTGEDSHKIEEYYPKNEETNQNGNHEEDNATKNGQNHEKIEEPPTKVSKESCCNGFGLILRPAAYQTSTLIGNAFVVD
ncbi:PCNA-associated factor domain-containing protein [Phthorimaea operculella]|nr:PCNA-associated factor domain-containing protein [Phthorimaea operculella]